MSTNIDSNKQELNSKALFAQDSENAFLFSPYYLRESHVLADQVSQVVPGGLYMMDDSGGVVSQLTNNLSGSKKTPATGTFTFATNNDGSTNQDYGATATISSNALGATSYKFLSPGNLGYPNNSTQQIAFSQNINGGGYLSIINLTRIKNDSIELIESAKANAVVVENAGSDGGYFYVYNVANRDSQLVLVHNIQPNNQSGVTSTAVNGMVYVEFQENAYVGLVDSTPLSFSDPDKVFEIDSSSPVLSA